MKLKNFFLIAIIISVLSCKQVQTSPYEGIEFLFNTTQPINSKEIPDFPKRFLGNYIDKDSTFLIINKKNIFYKWIKKSKISFQSFDSIKDSLKIIQNKIYLSDTKFVEIRKLKDSIEITEISYDTIFSISENQKLKKANAFLLLNTKDSIFWQTKFLILEKNNLKIKNLYSDMDLKRIDSLSQIKSQKIDSVKNIIHLSKNEFKKMLYLKKLGFDENFVKTN